MTHSLARMRTHRPTPPFRLGGLFAGEASRAFVRDALGPFELRGTGVAAAGAVEGDLVELTVRGYDLDAGRIEAEDVVVLRKASPGFRLPPRPRAVPFAEFVRAVRDHFVAEGLVEVHTPSLVTCPGLEPSLEPFRTELTRGGRSRDAYLPTSPEISLKKALASGWTDVFEIKPCFRRGEFSDHHANEFFMLEWYRAFADLDVIAADLKELVSSLGRRGMIAAGAAVETTDFASLFRELFDFGLTPGTTRGELAALATRSGVETRADDTFADVFHRLVVDRVEPALARRGPTIVRRFPPELAALAKLDTDGWGDRFEFYWRGLEIANAFHEVDDFEEQARRWQGELAERKRLGTSPLPLDGELIVAMRAGTPPAGGIALGVERLFMAGTGCPRIAELRLFDQLTV